MMKRTDPTTQAEMVRLYLQGATLAGAAAPFGLSFKAAQNALKRAGVPRREGGTPRNAPLLSLAGVMFGRLMVLGVSQGARGHELKWNCRCACGTEVSVVTGKLRSGHTQSCGCLRDDVHRANRERKHGPTKHPLRTIWNGMKSRCMNQNSQAWNLYGGRGINLCRGFADSFPHFLATVGERPSKQHSLDRRDNNKGYTCGRCEDCKAHGWGLNCRWATRKEQRANSRDSIKITYGGETRTLKDWGAIFGLSYELIHQRLSNGWDAKKALTTPKRPRLGQKRSAVSLLRNIWRGMIRRCHNPKCREFKWYGAKGVAVCQRWRDSFELFLGDMGQRPSPAYSLDRYPDPAGNYEPGNVRWATRKEQATNKRPDRAKTQRVIPRLIAPTPSPESSS